MALLPGGEERLPQMHHTTSDPLAADAVQQWPTNGAVHLVAPGEVGRVVKYAQFAMNDFLKQDECTVAVTHWQTR